MTWAYLLYFASYALPMKGTTNETHLSTEQEEARQDPWLPRTHGYQGWSQGPEGSPREGSQAPHRVANPWVHVLEIIKSSADITRVFNQGKRFGRGSSMLLVLEDEEQHGRPGRVAFVAGKKLGNAVWRNRAKRRMRAASQQLGIDLAGRDVVFVANRNTNDIGFSRMVEGYRKALRQAGLGEAE